MATEFSRKKGQIMQQENQQSGIYFFFWGYNNYPHVEFKLNWITCTTDKDNMNSLGDDWILSKLDFQNLTKRLSLAQIPNILTAMIKWDIL